jgi:hypothetical protein
MTSEIVHHLSPEEQELAQKRKELALLQAELIDRELFLVNLRAELAAFEGRYLREVGVLYAELDERSYDTIIRSISAFTVIEAAGLPLLTTALQEALSDVSEYCVDEDSLGCATWESHRIHLQSSTSQRR